MHPDPLVHRRDVDPAVRTPPRGRPTAPGTPPPARQQWLEKPSSAAYASSAFTNSAVSHEMAQVSYGTRPSQSPKAREAAGSVVNRSKTQHRTSASRTPRSFYPEESAISRHTSGGSRSRHGTAGGAVVQ